MRRLRVREERWPLERPFVIARGSKTEARVVVVELEEEGWIGRGESVPYARYGETPEGVLVEIESLRADLEASLCREGLQTRLSAGAARNVLDCALWDLEAKRSGQSVWRLAGLKPPRPRLTAYTLSLEAPEAMAAAARTAVGRPLLKLKIGGSEDLDRVRAVHQAAPHAQLIVDGNEALELETLRRMLPELSALGVVLVEQPLPAGADAALEGLDPPVPLCADEAVHTRRDLARVADLYGAVNIKLDKSGGLTEALALAAEAERLGLKIMVGCMVATSLAMAPAMLLAEQADLVDLDGPLLLRRDRPGGLRVEGSILHPPDPSFWG